MTKHEYYYLVKELVELRQNYQYLTDSLTPSWIKTLTALTPVISAIVSGGLSVWISLEIFKRTSNRELQRIKEADDRIKADKLEINEKERLATIRKMYGEISGVAQSLIIEIGIMNNNIINANYHLLRSKLENDDEKKEQLESRKRCEIRYAESINKSADITNKLIAIVNEYHFLNPNSNIKSLYQNFQKHRYEYEVEKKYEATMSKEELDKCRKQQLVDARTHRNSKIGKDLSSIVDCIFNETVKK